MQRRFSEIDSTNIQLELFRLKVEQMKSDMASISAEGTSLECEITSLKKAKTTTELDISKLKESILAAEQDLVNISTTCEAKKGRIESVKKEIDAKEEEYEDTSTIFNALNSHKLRLSVEPKAYSFKNDPVPTIEVFMEEKYMPDLLKLGVNNVTASTADGVNRIKGLRVGNPGTSPAEISSIIQNAERLVRGHNLKEEKLEEMAKNADLMDVDVVKVTVRNAKSKNRVLMTEWYYRLADAMALKFSVEHCYIGEGDSCFLFYGLRTNARMAAYMYKCVFNQIHLLSKVYKPDERSLEAQKAMDKVSSKAAFTRIMRLSYALRICIELIQNIKKELRERVAELEERANKLNKKAVPVSDGQIPPHKATTTTTTPGGADGMSVSDISSCDTETASENESTLSMKRQRALCVIQVNAPEQALKKAGIKLRIGAERRSYQDDLSITVRAGNGEAGNVDLNRRQSTN